MKRWIGGCILSLLVLVSFAAFAQSKISRAEAEIAWKAMVSDLQLLKPVKIEKGIFEKIGDFLGIGESVNAWDYGPTRKTEVTKEDRAIKTTYKRGSVVRETTYGKGRRFLVDGVWMQGERYVKMWKAE